MPLHKLYLSKQVHLQLHILSKMDLIDYDIRLPLVKISEETQEILDEIISNLEIK